MGGAVEFKAIEYIFNIYKINYLSCYVMKHNNDVIKLHKKLGFDEIEINEKDLKFMSKKDKKSVSKFLLTVKKWQIQKEIILRKYFEN